MPKLPKIARNPTWHRLNSLAFESLTPPVSNSSRVKRGNILLHPLHLGIVGEEQPLCSTEPTVGLLKDGYPHR